MTGCIAFLACLVAAAAAVRSTWSPCGLSMLSTITPVSERSKGHSYRSTAAWFVAGATAGGCTLGGVMALMALAVRGVGLSRYSPRWPLRGPTPTSSGCTCPFMDDR
jgi:hypothetical protein